MVMEKSRASTMKYVGCFAMFYLFTFALLILGESQFGLQINFKSTLPLSAVAAFCVGLLFYKLQGRSFLGREQLKISLGCFVVTFLVGEILPLVIAAFSSQEDFQAAIEAWKYLLGSPLVVVFGLFLFFRFGAIALVLGFTMKLMTAKPSLKKEIQ